MIRFTDSLGLWVADFYLLSSIFLVIALVAIAVLRQPVHRLTMAKSTLVSLGLLAGMCALPGWSVVHLMTAEGESLLPPSESEALATNQAPFDQNRFMLGGPAFQHKAAILPPSRSGEQPKASWLTVLALLQIAGAIGVVTWLAFGWCAARRLRSSARPAPAELTKWLRDIATPNDAQINVVELLISSRIDVPAALGPRRAAILLPESWIISVPLPFREGIGKGSPVHRLRTVLAHEWAHIANRDLHWLAAGRALMIALWSQPLYWLLRRRMRLDQESLADAAAAELSSREQYAEQLVDWARNMAGHRTMRLASAVGLWEVPSQLRQRLALLLDERLIILRHFSRNWQLAAITFCTLIAAALSLMTLEPAQSQPSEKPATQQAEAKKDSTEPKPSDRITIGDRFIFCPVTTELQRSLLGAVNEPQKDASLCVFVNFAAYKDDEIDKSSSFFAGLSDRLAKFAEVDNRHATFVVLVARSDDFEKADKRATALAKLCEQLGRAAGFMSAKYMVGFYFDWSKEIENAESAAKLSDSQVENSVGDDRIRVFPVRTFLSRMLLTDADCIVNILPVVRQNDGTRFPDDFVPSMQRFVPELKYARKKLLFMRARYVMSARKRIEDWGENQAGRKAFAQQFGFENSNLQQTQALDPEGDGKKGVNAGNDAQSNSRGRPVPNTVAGRTVNEKRQPIAGAEVFLFRINYSTSARKLVERKVTEADGEFQFKDVIDIAKEFPDGKLSPLNPLDPEFVQIYVRAPGRATESHMQMRQQVARAGDFAEVKLLPAATLTGRVTAPAGKPVAGALVSVGGLGYYLWEGARSARTDADGKFEIKDAAPFDIEEFRKQEAGQRRQMEALRANKADSSSADYVSFAPPVLAVEHPGFAAKYTGYEKIPGTQDVQLEPAAVIEGRVVFNDAAKPAAGATVRASKSRPRNTLPASDQLYSLHYGLARTDSEGKYRLTTLPAGSYDLSTEMPDWVNVGIAGFAAAGGKTQTAPDLVLTKGGVISIRVVDAKSGKPIDLQPDMRADITAQEIPFRSGSRAAWQPNAAANSEGRFELRTAPGKRGVFVFRVSLGDEPKWEAKPGPVGEVKPPAVVDVKEGETVQVDIPVVDVKDRN